MVCHGCLLDYFVSDHSLERILLQFNQHLFIMVVHEIRRDHIDNSIEIFLDWMELLIQLFFKLHLLHLQGSLCVFYALSVSDYMLRHLIIRYLLKLAPGGRRLRLVIGRW